MSPSNRPISVMQLVPRLETGGAEKTVVDGAVAVHKSNGRSIVVSQGGRLVKELEKFRIEHIRMPVASKNPLVMIMNVIRIYKVLKEKKIDIVHAHSRAPAWSALVATKIAKVKFVTTYHGAYGQSSYFKSLYNSVMVRSDVVVANSQWTAALIKSRYKIAENKIYVIPTGTNFQEFSPKSVSKNRRDEIQKKWGVTDKEFIILHLARLSKLKGQEIVIKAACKIVKENSDARFILAGDEQGRSQYKNKLEKLIKELDLENHVFLTGHCADPAAALSICDVSVSASTQPETLGLVSIEAQGMEKIVVVTDIGAVGETVKNGVSGWKIEEGNYTALADTIKKSMRLKPQKRYEMGVLARKFVMDQFSHETINRQITEFYKQTISS